MSADLTIALRIYPRVSKTPVIHSDNKFKLVDLSLRSMQRALTPLRAHIIVLLDACPPSYKSMVEQHLAGHDLKTIELNPKAGNSGTWQLQLDHLANQTESEYVYFAEDDYFYLPGAFSAMVSFLKDNPDEDFVTAYDHPEHYRHNLHDKRFSVKISGGLHWRDGLCTTLSFMCRRRAITPNKKIFLSYCTGNWDYSLWWLITRRKIWHLPWLAKTWLRGDHHERTIIWKLLKGLRRVRPGQPRRDLWALVPARATHLESDTLSPGIDWQAEFSALKRK